MNARICVAIRVINRNTCFIARSYHKKPIRNFSMDTENTWRGVPISEIIGSQSPWGAPEFPLVTPSASHAVLYHIPSEGFTCPDRPPKPRVAEDKWDSEHVRMPCSSKSLYPVENARGEPHLRKRWEMITEALQRPIQSSQELAEAILSYNTKFRASWRFTALHVLFNDHLDEEESRQFFIVTLPQIAKLALDLPKLIQAPIPLLKQNENKSLSLTQLQAASLLANAFFCTFPRRNTLKRASEYASYPHINFSSLYEQNGDDDVLEKLKCICHYFRRVTTQAPVGVLTVSRRSVAPSECPRWGRSQQPVGLLPVHVDSQGRIEDAEGLVQVDFANKYLGGGVLGHGSVQEEIRFVICPELIVTMLVTEVLRPKEALMVIGCERFSDYGGYSHSFHWRGDYTDASPRDSSLRRRTSVLAIDALPYRSARQQCRPNCLLRELNKAWVGMSFYTEQSNSLNYPGTATGNWGCGAFGGTPQLKSLIQIMACAESGRPMAYFTFNDVKLRDEIIGAYSLLVRCNVTVGQLYHYLMRFAATEVKSPHLYAFLHQAIVDDANKPTKSLDQIDTDDPTETQDDDLDSIQKEPLNDSPDMFSQEETEIQRNNFTEAANYGESFRESDFNTNNTSDSHKKETFQLKWNWDNRQSTDTSEKRNGDSKKQQSNLNSFVQTTMEDKKAPKENKMAPSSQTSRLFEEMAKFDEDNGKLNLNSSNYRRFSNEFNQSLILSAHKSLVTDLMQSDDKMASENAMVIEKESENDNVSLDEIVIASTGRVEAIESTQKSRDLFASDSTEQSSSDSQSKSQSSDTETKDIKTTSKNIDTTSKDTETTSKDIETTSKIKNMDISISSEEKRNKAKKITDYFTKKSI